MLRAAIIFFLMGLLAFLFGTYGIAGVTDRVGRLLLLTFSILSSLSFVAAVTVTKSDQPK